jgi:membrane-associated phospholipid phosphatase
VPLPDEPRLFSADEGGAPGGGDTVPEAAVAAYAIGVGAVIGLVPGEGRWYHFKGFLESTATTLALTEGAKATFGRHRPHWQPGDDDDDSRRSFFSGHSSLTFSTTTYLGLYLHQHVFDRWRDPGEHYAWWELGPHLLLAGAAAAVAWTRVEDERHHKSDVITGAAVGTVSSVVFYAWQQSRLRGHGERSNLSLGPGPGHAGVSLQLVF